MEAFAVRTELTLADWQAYQKTCGLRLQQQSQPWLRVLNIFVGVVIGLGAFYFFKGLRVSMSPAPIIFGFGLAIMLMLLARLRATKSAVPDPDGAFFNPSNYRFSADGIDVAQSGLQSHSRWSRVRDVTASAQHMFIWTDRFAAYVLPLRDLPAGMSGADAITRMRAWMALPAAQDLQIDMAVAPSAAAVEEVSNAVTPQAPESVTQSWPKAVLRLLTLQSVDAASLQAKTSTILLLVLLAIALWAGFGWLDFASPPQFYAYELPVLAWFALAALLLAIILSQRSHPAIDLRHACMLVAILIPVLIAINFAIGRLISERWAGVAQLMLLGYAIVYCDRALKSLTGRRQPAALGSVVAAALVLVGLNNVLYINPSLWTETEAYDNAASEDDWDGGEALLFEQPARIDAELDNIVRPSGEAPVGFFVGFAGYGDQRVFAEEVKFASQVFATRYDTSSRTLLLLNDRREFDAQPLASVSGLRYALQGIAAKMQLDRDVLFLVLSSHGSADPLLSVSNGSIPLQDLTGDQLAEALSESAIKWRVIVISACHAGAFIEPLKDPHTIVITAAAPDRSSFGCSDERDLTYFGEAFLRDSLPNSKSLRDAFNSAKRLVAQREQEQGEEPSDPRAFFGQQIEHQVARIAAGT